MNEADQIEHNATKHNTLLKIWTAKTANNTEYDRDDMKIYMRKWILLLLYNSIYIALHRYSLFILRRFRVSFFTAFSFNITMFSNCTSLSCMCALVFLYWVEMCSICFNIYVHHSCENMFHGIDFKTERKKYSKCSKRLEWKLKHDKNAFQNRVLAICKICWMTRREDRQSNFQKEYCLFVLPFLNSYLNKSSLNLQSIVLC